MEDFIVGWEYFFFIRLVVENIVKGFGESRIELVRIVKIG